MDDPAATLDSEGKRRQNSRSWVAVESAYGQPGSDQTIPVQLAGGRVMKFAYASGSKPLDGYTIKRGIGIGGFGEVYFALSDAGKEVALKRIQRNLDVELRGVRQCLNLKHINLISLWDIRTNNLGESWVVMEYVPGTSLHDAVDANPNGMPEADVKQWFTSTAAGVAYLHDQGIVHRDLKPANIFFDEDQQVIKIGDYGLSKFISCSRRSGQTESVGTFHYMAPEIGKGVYGKEIDIYALGIILFEILTGRVPFDGESSQEIIMKHLTADPDLSVVPDLFRKVIQKALLKDPELRYHNVPELCSDLPWPDVAENSQDIVKRNAIGPVVLNGFSDKPNLAQTQAGKQKQPLKFPSLLSGERAEIVFGELKDSSAGNTSIPNPLPLPHESTRQNEPVASTTSIRRNVPRPDPVQVIKPDRVANPSTPTVRGEVVDEPVARVVKTGFDSMVHWWTNGNISTPVKVAILIAGTYAFATNSNWLLPTVLGLSLIYLIYFIGRNVWLAGSSEEKPAKPKVSKRELASRNNALIRTWLGNREASDKVMELTGSLLIAALSCIVFNLLAFVLGGDILAAGVQRWASFAWMTLTAVGAAWALLIVSKSWEHREGDPWLRRLTVGTIGLLVGGLAFTLAGSFSVDLSSMKTTGFSPLPNLQVGPVLPTYLALFTGLFMILRWWRQSDPIRRTRLSIWAVGLCLVWAAVLSQTFGINPLWNSILAVVISISVQLASPWLHPQDRKRIHVESINASAVTK